MIYRLFWFVSFDVLRFGNQFQLLLFYTYRNTHIQKYTHTYNARLLNHFMGKVTSEVFIRDQIKVF